MKKLILPLAALAALAFAGCSSYSELAYWDKPVQIENGEVPRASFVTQNFSYSLLGFIPLCTGRPWTEGDEDVKDDFDVRLFADEATLDNNLVSLRYALKRAGSNRIEALSSFENDDAAWSLFLVNKHEVSTKCLILSPVDPEQQAK